MTHSLSFSAAERPAAMYRNATLAMLVSSTSMNVATVTATAITHGLTPRGASEAGVSGPAMVRWSLGRGARYDGNHPNACRHDTEPRDRVERGGSTSRSPRPARFGRPPSAVNAA